jgi:predicted RND superfamily exporter protein
MSLRRAVAIALVALTAAAAVAASRMRVDNRLERWVDTDPGEARRYREFRDRFGSDEFVVVALSGAPLFDPASLDAMVAAQERLEAVPGVTRVDSLAAVYRDLFGGEDPEALEAEATSTPFYRGLLLSDDSKVTAMLVEVDPAAEPEARHRIVGDLRRAVEPLEAEGFSVELVGSTVLVDALDELSKREALRTLPAALVASMLVLALLVRSWRGMAVAAACSGATVLLTLGLMVATGHELHMMSSALPSLLWVLALGNSVHVLQRYQRLHEQHSVDDAVSAAVADATLPGTLATLTTALGFLSLVTADMAPVREVGLFAALGLVLSLPLNLVLGPELIRLLRVPARRSVARAGAQWSARTVLRRPRLILALAALVTVAAALVIPRVRVASNPLAFLPSGHEVSRAYRTTGERIAGFYSLEVVLQSDVPWTDPRLWPVVDGLQARLESSPVVAKVVSPLDLLRKLRQWQRGFDPAGYALPFSREEAESLLAGLDGRGRQLVARLVTGDGRTFRLSAIVNEMDEGAFLELVAATRQDLAQLPNGVSGSVTGMVLRLVEAQQDLVSSQLRSLGLACVVIFVVIAFGLRSWRLGLLSLPPNVLPVVVIFALMALVGIPLDAATVMVASVALGISVDNNIHLLTDFRRERWLGGSRRLAAGRAVDQVGAAMVVTTATTCIGFFSLCLSAFVPIREFGFLVGSAMLIGLAADLWMGPALLTVTEEVP